MRERDPPIWLGWGYWHAVTFRSDIEGIRAIAVTMVVVFHAGLGSFSGGYVGVDIFFALSGFLITTLLLAEHRKKGHIDLKRFYARRARRLLPASVFLVMTVLLVSALLHAPEEQRTVARTAVAVALYSSNLLFTVQAGDYLGAGLDDNPLLHTWSLGVEEQFYFVWPLAILLASRLGMLRGLLLGTVAVGLPLATVVTATNQPWAFFFSPLRAWEFAIGGVGAVFTSSALASVRGTGWSIAGLLAMVVPGLVFYEHTTFPGLAAAVPTAGTVVLLVAGTDVDGPVQRLLATSPFQEIGRLSYSWYLWHWPFLVFLPVYLLREPSVVETLMALGLSLVASKLSYELVEQPLRHSAFLKSDVRSLALGGVLSCWGLALAGGALLRAESVADFPPFGQLTHASTARPDTYARGCHLDFRSTAMDLLRCTIGPTDAPRVLLMGDSHAAHWYPAFQALAEAGEIRLTAATKSSCRPVGEALWLNPMKRDYTECKVWFDALLEQLPTLRPAVVVVGARSVGPTAEQWARGLARIIDAADGVGTRVAFLPDVAEPPGPRNVCLGRHILRGLDPAPCAFERHFAGDFNRVAAELSAARQNVWVLDTNADTCPPGPDGRCAVLWQGIPVWRDGSHISVPFAAAQVDVVRRAIAPALAGHPGSRP